MHRLGRLLDAGRVRLGGAVRRASRYDLVLAAIPAVLLIGALAGLAGSVDLTTAVGAAAGVSALVVLDALFFNPPRRPSAGSRTA